MAAPEELAQNVQAAENTGALTPEEEDACSRVRKALGTQFLPPLQLLRPPAAWGSRSPTFFCSRATSTDTAWRIGGAARYASLPVKASACVQCGACEPRCPYNLPIRQMMKKAAQDFGE